MMVETAITPDADVAGFRNPFTPIFGGRLESFFGREDVTRAFDRALSSPGSGHRALFITGVRGLGKTSLLEHLSQTAREAGWTVHDLPPEATLRTLMGRLVPYDEITSTHQPSHSVEVGGFGVSHGGVGDARTWHVAPGDLCDAFVTASAAARKGTLITIDEVQKVPLEHLSQICSAFQMASRKGNDVALVVAGLPFAYDEIAHHDGCTYMRRSRHVRLQLLERGEVRHAYERLLGGLRRPLRVVVEDPALEALVDYSKGQPFLMQLLGFSLVDRLDDYIATRGKSLPESLRITSDWVDAAFEVAMGSYEEQQLSPIMVEAGTVGASYLQAMARVMARNGDAGPYIATTSEVARELGRDGKSLSTVRSRLLRYGIIVAVGQGRVRFNVPYLREYAFSQPSSDEESRRLDDWGV